MNKLIILLLSSLLIASQAFGQYTPVPTSTATATPTARATWAGDKGVADTATWDAATYKGAMQYGNPDKMPQPLNIGTPGQILIVSSSLLPQWSSTPNLGGAVFTFSGYLPGIANDTGTVAATGSSITDSAALVDIFNVVTAADGTKGVHLPALADLTIGQSVTVVNADVTSALKVYSNAAGETISAQAGNTAISVAAKLWLLCFKQSTTAWHCTKTVTAY